MNRDPSGILADEAERLEALRRYGILDTPDEADFDDFTWIASHICDTPIALISLVDMNRQWFKSRVGVAVRETPRELSFCVHAIRGDGLLEVRDTTQDTRFSQNILVTSDPHIRFYAGIPLKTPDGHKLGSLCVLDRVARELTETQRETLTRLGRQVMAQFELRMAREELKAKLAESRKAQEAKEFMSAIVESSVDAIIGLSLENIVTSWNSGAERIFGYTAAEMIGHTAERIIPPDRMEERRVMLGRIRNGERLEHFETVRLARGGQRIQMSLSISPIRNADGELLAISVVGRDITEKKRQEDEREKLIAELQDANTEILTLSSLLPMCSWCRKVRDDRGYWDDLANLFSKREGVKWSHGVCPECSKRLTSTIPGAPKLDTAYFAEKRKKAGNNN